EELRVSSLNAFIARGNDEEVSDFLNLLIQKDSFSLSDVPKDFDFSKFPTCKKVLFLKYSSSPTEFLKHFAGKDLVLKLFLAECTSLKDWTDQVLIAGLSKEILTLIDAKNSYSCILNLKDQKTCSLFSIAIKNDL